MISFVEDLMKVKKFKSNNSYFKKLSYQ